MAETVYGDGDYRFRVVPGWGRGADGVPALGLVSMVACDANDNVYVFQRAPEPVMLVFDRDGRLLRRWGEGQFKHPHGVWIGPDQTCYCTDRDRHAVTQWTLDGQLLRTWGTVDQAGAPGEPFNEPTRAFATPAGNLYVSDGYGQHRVHHFAADGTLLRSWGEQGVGPSQFGWPVHSVWLDSRERLLVVDRQNGRVQHFTSAGDYTGEWSGLLSPNDLYIDLNDIVYLIEGGRRVTITDLDGTVLSRWGVQGDAPGEFAASPHSGWVDSRGDLYIGEVTTHDRFQKFERV
jgi:hypothetical protein